MTSTHQRRHQLGMLQIIVTPIMHLRCTAVPLSKHFATRWNCRPHSCCGMTEEGRRVLDEAAHCVRHCGRRLMMMMVVVMVSHRTFMSCR